MCVHIHVYLSKGSPCVNLSFRRADQRFGCDCMNKCSGINIHTLKYSRNFVCVSISCQRLQGVGEPQEEGRPKGDGTTLSERVRAKILGGFGQQHS